MEEFYAVLESCGARHATTAAERERLGSAWSEHWRYVSDRDLECAGCYRRVGKPYATCDGRASSCWCIECAPVMPIFPEDSGGAPGHVVAMHNFTGVIVCTWADPASRKETSDPP